MTVTELPHTAVVPDAEAVPRWVPERAGILNVWRYYDEVFTFHKGRLLLRGPNGTGKSKALELLLPFLFDANLRANRLSTFGTSERTMHWNLMGEGASGVTRVGYVWLEFRFTDGASERWFTCGARLAATKHTSAVHPDYFTTGQRVDEPGGLLLKADGHPLTKKALESALGEHGVLHQSAADYRAAVRSTLFPGLSEQRYDALITALLQLRTPKLSQRLDPALLSTLLSKALPPLGEAEIGELAEGFERLDRQREQLKRLDDEVEAARDLRAKQRAYAQRVLRAASAGLISATTEMSRLADAAKQSEEEHRDAARRKDEAVRRGEALDDRIADTEGRIEGLVDSEAYRRGQELDRLRTQAREASATARSRRADATRLREVAEADEEEAASAAGIVESRSAAVRSMADEVVAAATRVGLGAVPAEIGNDPADTSRSRMLLRAAVQARTEQVTSVRAALDEHDRAVSGRQQAETALEEAREDLSEATAHRVEAAEHRDTALAELTDAVRDWAAGCRELVFPDPDAVADLVASEAAVLAEVDAAAGRVLHVITRDETLAESAVREAEREKAAIAAEIARLSGVEDLPPDPPPTRTADRATLTGAPLWRLVRFADAVPDHVRASVEAALQASGLLDAWVGHDGAVEGHDTFAVPDAAPAAPGGSLADILVPETDAAVPADVVIRLLAGIAYGERLPDGHPAAIGADGGWRLANVRGTWHKDEAAHIGALARRNARQRRLAELRERITALDAVIEEHTAVLRSLASRRAALEAERAGRPGHARADEAALELTRAESAVSSADGVVRRSLDALAGKEQEVNRALRGLTAVAAEHGLPADRAALTAVDAAVAGFRAQADAWIDGHAVLLSARDTAARLAAQAGRSRSIAEQRESEAGEAETRALRLGGALEAVEGTIGVDYRQVLDELADLRDLLVELKRQANANRGEANGLAERLGELNSRRVTDAQARDRAAEARDLAAERFRHLARGSFPADGDIADLPSFAQVRGASSGVRAVLDAARAVAATWPTLPHSPKNLGDAAHRLAESVHACRAVLSGRADLDLDSDEDVQVFSAMVDGVRVGAAALFDLLRREADQSRQDITGQERELFDKTLTGDTRRHLAARIRQAHELVDGMNARLERVRTASKVAVRLVWEVSPDLPPGTKAARDLLLKDPVRLTDADRESLHRFFRDRIEQAKADDTAVGWEQQLGQVFDYTGWHRFVVKVDRANGSGWQPLTRKLHGALSGGEKAIALHLPLFAAVAAHYQAVSEAPRIILLDEVFVGVDSANRGQVFELLSALDLDLVLTSDHEWCTYRELDGIAIHQLITGGDGDDAVTTARFVWDGADLVTGEARGDSGS
ncbi:TIGR02680 family protein [Saccharothrix sp. ALI-22-I]|uniref:TIGR02680 family protein n=1 Tax=Saccharothrix sp. ALI-22-I TaxID=1933778 RepID=UPI00097BF46B|nr:TIGR02680 family protein [Saccharothrix sp. ALI-22-I]ONI85456.1 TIGR02680 family protein [Saccharothrix sp. ALI-22-I]